MEQSQLGKIVATLKIAYPYAFKDMKSIDVLALTQLYDRKLKEYPYDIVLMAVDNIIDRSSIMPSVSDIKKECGKCRKTIEYDILKKMYDAGYFNEGVEKLSPEHALRNYEKATMWLSKGIIPQFLLEDMMNYGYRKELQNIPLLLLEDSDGREDI